MGQTHQYWSGLIVTRCSIPLSSLHLSSHCFLLCTFLRIAFLLSFSIFFLILLHLYLQHFFIIISYRVSQKKVSDKIFPQRLPNGRGLRTNFQLNCEASLKTWSFPQKSSRQTSGKRPGVRRQSLQLVRSPRPLGSRQGKILSETFFWDTLYVCNRCNI